MIYSTYPQFHISNVDNAAGEMLDDVMCVGMSTKSANFLRVGDPQKYNHKNAGFVTSLKFTYLENLYV